MVVKEPKHITVSLVLGYIVGIFAFISGLGILINSLLGGILIIVGGLIIFPPSVRLIEKKLNVKLSKWLKIMGFLILFIMGISLSGVKNCGSDGECFEEALKTCSRIKAEITGYMADREWEIKGKEGERCKISYNIYTIPTIKKYCYIKKGIDINGSLGNINDKLEDCNNKIS